MLVSQFLRHIQIYKNYSPHTVEAYRRDLADFQSFLWPLSDCSLEDPKTVENLSHKDIRRWLAEQIQSGLGPRTVSRKLAAVKSFLGYLYRQQVITANPAQKVRGPAFRVNLPSFVSEKEMGRLLDQIEFPSDFEGIRDLCMLELLYGCGIRRSELIELKTADVDLYDCQIKITGKGNKERIIPFGQAVRSQLLAYQACRADRGFEDHPFLFLRKNGKSIYPSLLYRVVQKYMGMVDSPQQKSPHVIRHSYATHLLNQGADLQSIKELLGHTSLSATQVYTHHSLSRLKRIHQQAHPTSETDQID